MKRKFLLIGLMLLFALFCVVGAGCLHYVPPTTLEFELNEDGQSYTLRFNGVPNHAEIVIPETYNDLPVTKIRQHAFLACPKVEKIVLPDSITEIQTTAFTGCTKLKEITLPKNVASIGENIFDNCKSLENIFVAEENPYFQSIDGVLYSKNGKILYEYPAAKAQTSLIIPEGVEIIESYAFESCQYLTEIILPNSLKNIRDTYFDTLPLTFNEYNNAYYIPSVDTPYFALIKPINQEITSLVLHEDTQLLTACAFSGCKQLTNVQLSQNIEVIPPSAFFSCENLQSITLPSSVTCIDEYAFFNCKALTSINLDNITNVQDKAFSDCTSLTSINLKNATHIGYFAFGDCSKLSSITFEKIEELKGGAFRYCNLTKVELGKELQYIEASTFMGCNQLTEISISKENPLYKSIDGNVYSKDGTILIAYAYGQPSSFVVPDGVVELGKEVFYYCKTIKTLTLPNSLKKINTWAVNGCLHLTKIIYKGSLAEWKKIKIIKSQIGTANITVVCNDGKTKLKT